jgi:hypothetical protein
VHTPFNRGSYLSSRRVIAIEVIHSVPLLNKLDVYSQMGIAEVWVYQKGSFTIWRLLGERYEAFERSALLPDLDFSRLARLVPREDTLAALRELEAAERGATV